jgi:hypothetical protein
MNTYDHTRSTIELINANEFLPMPFKKDSLFSVGDSKSLYSENLKIQPHDWFYRKAPVSYKLNSQGYRTAEFKDIVWEDSVVIFGCSNVFGVGVTDEDTLSSQLSNIIGMPVINMGFPGSGPTLALHLATVLSDRYPTPKAVINLWAGVNRISYYNQTAIHNHGPWSIGKGKSGNDFMTQWMKDETHGEVLAMLASRASKILWEDTVYLETTYAEPTANLLECSLQVATDNARDITEHGMAHPGRKSHRNVAKYIADTITSQLT